MRLKAGVILIGALGFAVPAAAQGNGGLAQVVALDECEPSSFNMALGESGGGFCHNVALATFGYATSLSDLLMGAENGSPDPGWDFEPDQLTIKQGTVVSVVEPGRRAAYLYGSESIRQRIPAAAQSWQRHERNSGVQRRLQEHRGCQDASCSRQPSRYRWPVEREASIPMLHPSLDADGSGREVAPSKTVGVRRGRAPLVPEIQRFQNTCRSGSG
jgi:hypothetical protein